MAVTLSRTFGCSGEHRVRCCMHEPQDFPMRHERPARRRVAMRPKGRDEVGSHAGLPGPRRCPRTVLEQGGELEPRLSVSLLAVLARGLVTRAPEESASQGSGKSAEWRALLRVIRIADTCSPASLG